MSMLQNRWKYSLQRAFSALSVFLAILFWSGSSFLIGTQDVSGLKYIKSVRIFDGEIVISEGSIIIENGKIVNVGRNLSPPDKAEVIDGKGKTLLPGLIDAHVHIVSPQDLKQALVFGVTTVIDMSMDVKMMANIKKRQESGLGNQMAYMISAGTAATVPGGHGTQFGMNIPTLTKPEEAQHFVDARIAEGADFIKIIYDDGTAYALSWPTLELATVKAVIEAAHKRGKIAVIHSATLKNCIDSLEGGADGLAHLYFDNAYHPEFGELAAQKKAFVIPTLSVIESISGTSSAASLTEDSCLGTYLKPSDIQNLKMSFGFKTGRKAYEAAEKALQQLKATGVPILAGTDAPNPGTTYGVSLHHELELLVRAGLTPLEALKSATSIPAERFHMKNRGRIRPGYVADVLLVNGDPTKDIKSTRNIAAIWRNGVKVNRQKYVQSVEKEKEKIRQLKNAPPPKNSKSGWISDFEKKTIAANFGSGWRTSTDAIMGGKSKVQYTLVKGGVHGSKGSLLITGTIAEGSQYRWAGAMFFPGPTVMAPANLSFKENISFWAKGDGRSYAILIYAQSRGFIPVVRNFVAGPEWKEYVFPFKTFDLEGFDIMGIFIGAYKETEEFSIQIDNVRLK